MAHIKVPDNLSDGLPQIIDSKGLRIISYTQEEEVEQVNVQLTQNLVVFVTSGYKKLLGESKNKIIRKGEGFLIKKGNYLLSEKLENDEFYKSMLFFFSDKFAHQFTSSLIDLKSGSENIKSPMRTFETNNLLKSYLAGLSTYLQDSDLSDMEGLAKLKLQELFLLLIKGIGDEFKSFLSNLGKSPAKDLREFMNMHYKENLTLKEYAFLSGHSLSTFKRLFKKEFNTTPGRWVKQKQLQESKFLLRSKRLNVTQVCFEVGFKNLSHFVQAFKRRYGITPKQFQLEQRSTKSES
ncbi:helix-turn-helix domain-containing protein [Fodinibius saliphilus]|uniref:helix-turn-helix domain-containing protein n=1 Tax=Fodinibius saliphilus TaxID=1920650 RepID=UPI001108394E|nr:AraC family transcriptional regulator [Fodinibius saliphilus]